MNATMESGRSLKTKTRLTYNPDVNSNLVKLYIQNIISAYSEYLETAKSDYVAWHVLEKWEGSDRPFEIIQSLNSFPQSKLSSYTSHISKNTKYFIEVIQRNDHDNLVDVIEDVPEIHGPGMVFNTPHVD